MAQTRQNPDHRLYPIKQSTRSDELLTAAVLIALLLLVGIVGLFWSAWNRLVFAPTPTPTATESIAITLTAEVHAIQTTNAWATETELARLVLDATATTEPAQSGTQTAVAQQTSDAEATRQVALATAQTAPTTQAVLPPSDNSGTATVAPTSPALTVTVTITDIDVRLPVIQGPQSLTLTLVPSTTEQTDPATVTPSQPITTPLPATPIPTTGIFSPVLQFPGDTDLETAIASNPTPTDTPSQPLVATSAPTLAPSVPITTSEPAPVATSVPIAPATATPTLSPTPEPTRFTQELVGIIRVDKAKMRAGPSTIFSQLREVELDKRVTLAGRNVTGEWIWVRYPTDTNDVEGWLRQAEASPIDNALEDGAPEDAEPNDVRWLPIVESASESPVPQPQAVPANVFPILRGNNANHGVVAQLPVAPLAATWGATGRAGNPVLSPVTISNNGVLASSEDGNLYRFSFESGEEQWRFAYDSDTQKRVVRAAMVQGPFIYTVDDTGVVYGLEDKGTLAEKRWTRELQSGNQNLLPATDLTLRDNYIYLVAHDGNVHYLMALQDANGTVRFTQKIDGTQVQYPAIGGQLVFIGTNLGVVAKDVLLGSTVWTLENDQINQVSAPPVYMFPGVDGLAELFVARGGGEVVALDANTNAEIWRFVPEEGRGGEIITSMTLDNERLYVSGTGFIKAIDREEHIEEWRLDLASDATIPGGPLLSTNALLLVTNGGEILFIDPTSGAIQSQTTAARGLTNAFAANGSYIYFPAPGNTVLGYRGQ